MFFSFMGNSSSLRRHIETAEKTGCFQLARSNLRDIPRNLYSIGQLLRTLDLSGNRLQSLDSNIEVFKILKIFNLSSNQIKTLPPSIGSLVKLEQLNLSSNLLTSLPREIIQLENLKILSLSSNKFIEFPKEVCSLPALDVLDLSSNAITSIPDEIAKCNASEINLNNNSVTRLNECLVGCSNLKILRLDNNKIDIKSITKPILESSKLCLLSVEQNPFSMKQLQSCDGYGVYIQRYTSTKKKLF